MRNKFDQGRGADKSFVALMQPIECSVGFQLILNEHEIACLRKLRTDEPLWLSNLSPFQHIKVKQNRCLETHQLV